MSGELAAGLALASACFLRTFGGPRTQFWSRMTQTGAVLGGVALVATPELRRPRLEWRDLCGGLGAAAALYAVFQVGDRLARAILPSGARDVADIYALRTLRPWPELALRLATVIAPSEELFWRGFVQVRLAKRFGTWPAAALATASYGAAHLTSRNLTLIGAASVAGAFWSALAAGGTSMSALVVSHIVWDIWVFLVAPTAGDPTRHATQHPVARGHPARAAARRDQDNAPTQSTRGCQSTQAQTGASTETQSFGHAAEPRAT